MPDDNKDDAQAQRKKKFFVREIDTSLLRRNAELSKNARLLHGTLRAMADAKTGELRIRDHWWTPAEIDREAQISHVTRKAAMRELIAAGLADSKRDRITVTVKDRLSGKYRKRVVLGRAHYSVSAIPRPDWLSFTVKTQKPKMASDASTVKNLYYRRKQHKQRVSLGL